MVWVRPPCVLWIQFWKSSEVFGKWSEIFGKSSKTSLLVCLYNKQNITCPLVDINSYLLVFNSISHSFAAITRAISSETLEDKIHIPARACNILYVCSVTSFCQTGYKQHKIREVFDAVLLCSKVGEGGRGNTFDTYYFLPTA